MAYVPPHKRVPGGDTVSAVSSSRSAIRTVDGNASTSFYTGHELENCLGVDHLHTLSESPATPDSLTAIIIHNGQHPDWPSTILCKTNVHLLPSDATVENHEYPLFKEVPFRGVGRGKVFEFDGWWRIVRIDFLEPQSQELISMLDRKFSRPQRKGGFASDHRDQSKARRAEAWADSLSRRWAVVLLEKNIALKDNPVSELAEATQRILRLRDEQSSLQNTASDQVGHQTSLDGTLLSEECIVLTGSP